MQKTIFISDLHLEEATSQQSDQFLSLLAQLDSNVDALYILGDFFEYWIGDDDNTSFHRTIKAALKGVADKNIPVYFMHGNRDFLIGKSFLRETGCFLLPDEKKINLYGTPVLLMHGDTLCTKDITYQKARRWLRNCFLQALFLGMPLSCRRKLAQKIRAKSMHYTKHANATIMDVTQTQVESVMLSHGVTHLIHGHTHREQIHSLILNEKPATRIVLGSWHDGANALFWYASGKYEISAI